MTFPEGSTVLDIAQKLEENNVCTADEFEAVCTKVPEGYDRLFADVTTDNKVFVLEGYLFPSTYEFYKEEGADKAVKRFLDAIAAPVATLFMAALIALAYPQLRLPARVDALLDFALHAIIVFSCVWALYRLADVFCDLLAESSLLDLDLLEESEVNTVHVDLRDVDLL